MVYDPLRQELFTASRGEGAQVDGKRIRVSKQITLDGSLIGTGFPFRDNIRWLDNYMQMMRLVIEQTAGVRRPGSAALDLAYVAAGRLDGFWELGLSPWDTAAGCLLVREAGGFVTDFRGRSEPICDKQVLAGNDALHSRLHKIIAGALRD